MSLAIWGLAEPAVAIMAASIPAMRLLVRSATKPRKIVLEDGYTSDHNSPIPNPKRRTIGGSAY